jgi:1-acyl-sn-glycerol-3-phosphate acyltransferase
MKQVDYIWRLFGSVLGFTAFGVGGLIISVIVSPLIFLLVRDPASRQRTTRHMTGYLFVVFLWIIKGMGVLSYRITGMENIRHGNNKLIIANHPTLIDVIFLASLFPMVGCVVKPAVFKNPAMRGVVKPARYISSGPPGKMINACVDHLKSGNSLLLFPEGTRSVYGQPVQFKLGASSIAIRSEAEFLPVVIQCNQPRYLSKNEPWYKIPPQKPFISIHIQNPVTINELIAGDLNSRESIRALNKSLVRYFEEELTSLS